MKLHELVFPEPSLEMLFVSHPWIDSEQGLGPLPSPTKVLEFFGVGFFGGEGVFGVAEFFFLIFIGVQLLYNVVLVSAIQQIE